jgi:hypothetical protein
MLAVSRTVSPCAIWDLPSSRSCSARPRKLAALAKLNRVRVELSRKIEMASPLSENRAERLLRRRPRSISATVNTAAISSSVFSHVSRKSAMCSPPVDNRPRCSIFSSMCLRSIFLISICLYSSPTLSLKSSISASIFSTCANVPFQYRSCWYHCSLSSLTSRPCCSTQVKYLRLWIVLRS